VLGGILEFAGLPGFLEDRNELFERADAEGSEWRAFVKAWSERLLPGPKSSGDLAAFCEREQLLDSLFAGVRTDSTRGRATRLGKALAAREGRVFSGLRLARTVDAHGCRALWLLERLDDTQRHNGEGAQPAPAGHAGLLQDIDDACPAAQATGDSEVESVCRTCRTFSPSLTHVCACACARACAKGRDEVLQVLQPSEHPRGTGDSAAGHSSAMSGTTSCMSCNLSLFDGTALPHVSDGDAGLKLQQELIDERAAILEFEAGLSRSDSEQEADSVIRSVLERAQ
jgi:hypothetical protein